LISFKFIVNKEILSLPFFFSFFELFFQLGVYVAPAKVYDYA